MASGGQVGNFQARLQRLNFGRPLFGERPIRVGITVPDRSQSHRDLNKTALSLAFSLSITKLNLDHHPDRPCSQLINSLLILNLDVLWKHFRRRARTAVGFHFLCATSAEERVLLDM